MIAWSDGQTVHSALNGIPRWRQWLRDAREFVRKHRTTWINVAIGAVIVGIVSKLFGK